MKIDQELTLTPNRSEKTQQPVSTRDDGIMQSWSVLSSCLTTWIYFQNLLSLLTLQWTALCLPALWTLEKNIVFLCHTGGVISLALVFPGVHLQFLAMGSAFGEISSHFMPSPLSQGQVTSLQVTCCGQGCFPWPGLLPFKCFSVLTVSQVEHRMFVALVRG